MLEVEWEDLPALLDMHEALDPNSMVIHPDLGDNICFKRSLDTGDVDAQFVKAEVVASAEFRFGRHTGVTLEPRCQIADFGADGRLTVYHSQQAPHMMQDLYCRQFGLVESDVRVICHDVGGSFGIKVHAYPDDFATVGLSILLKRPIKFVADRLESYLSDIHAREHIIQGKIAVSKDGEILAFEIEDLTGIGP
jgi:carbon-monoxide dehydrogenase large subunit